MSQGKNYNKNILILKNKTIRYMYGKNDISSLNEWELHE